MTTTPTDTRALEELSVNTIRTLSMDAVQKANSGHPGAPMALAPLAYVLYTRVMKHNPKNPEWFDRDRFVLSAGHASMLLYSILYLTGYGLELEDLKNFRQLGSRTPGHPERHEAPGVEITTGPLGQGVGNAVGFALAERMLAARFNRDGHDIIDHHTFCIASDGDMMEGVASEASSLAGHLGLGKLTIFYDNNHISLDGPTSLSFSDDVGKRYEAYGWHVQDLGEDLELDNLEKATRAAMEVEDQPSLVILRTHIGYGSPNKQDTKAAHGSALGEDEVELTKKAYGWPTMDPFYVPDDALAHFRECIDRGVQFEQEWDERAERYEAAHSDLWHQLKLIMNGELPENWDSNIPRLDPSDGAVATRKAGQQALDWLAGEIPNLLGGAADLSSSTLSTITDGGEVSRDDYGARNIYFGVREHGMGAVVNGLVAHGFRALGATFLQFSAYMKNPIRLAALMKLPSLFIYTHDSIGLGEDGPTHQPVEHLAGLRAIPNLYVIRPADANETMLAWRFAMWQLASPVAIVETRQGLPILDPDKVPIDAVDRGAYVLSDPPGGEEPDVQLIASGSEVKLCIDAQELLQGEGIAARVISVPCAERFFEQEDGYRDEVLLPGVRARVAVEAAAKLGWERFAGDLGSIVGMDTFGASAPDKALFEHFGFTPQRVAEEARASLERARR
ncbi:MAG TPA: transketolase [Thermoleophilaceae bacterium]|nr:transketolase [Thermoleophilaceae bacterium]